MKKLVLKLIKFYQKYLSFDTGLVRLLLPQFTFRVCRHVPTCSEYTYQAVEKYGILAGLLKGAKRVACCNPLSKHAAGPLL
ncbi:MAG: membrane protein insertion efficiency factor YidD [Patescibacteria group bacterium]